MVVIALASHDVDRKLPSLRRTPSPLPALPVYEAKPDSTPYESVDSGVAFPPPDSSGPTTPPERPRTTDPLSTAHRTPPHDPPPAYILSDSPGVTNAEAGPSRSIPPPPTPRRHRSGVIMSRVRAHSGGTSFKSALSMTSSKSWGDLSAGLTVAPGVIDELGGEDDPRRVVSDGTKSRRESDADEQYWDNS